MIVITARDELRREAAHRVPFMEGGVILESGPPGRPLESLNQPGRAFFR